MRLLTVIFLALTLLALESRADEQTITLAGLEKPAEIIIDKWGVPHIYAGTHYDAFFVQGFNAARDRLWQIDVWRRRGLGLLAEVLGPEYLQQDRANRLFLFRGNLYREWLAYGSDAKKIAESFTAGINAYIDLIDSKPELMPVEFGLLDYAPERWKAEDIVRVRSHGLSGNVSRELKRAIITCELGPEATNLQTLIEPAWEPLIPEGLDLCFFKEDVLDVYRLAKSPVVFDMPEESMALAESKLNDPNLGSNNWVVAPSRTDTGRAILANDPHRSHSVPSLRYISHLVAPDLNVIGAGEPGLPGISIGHNERIAFGLTIFRIDQEDMYVYKRSGDGYEYAGKSEALRTYSEKINVRGQSSTTVELKYTRHGPVVFEDKDYLVAIRAAWLDYGMAPYFGSVEYMRASDWREFLAALNRWGAPPENQVYADVDGNIGYKPAGLFPIRRNWDGLLPVPGDGRYEWDGYHDMDVLPVEYNPDRGFTGSANSMNLPKDYPIDAYRIGFEWSDSWRYKRLWEVLENQPAHTLDNSLALQRDYQSVLARRIVALLPEDASNRSLSMLKNWDGVMAPDSAAAALFSIWYHRHLNPRLAIALAEKNPQLVAPVGSHTVLEQVADSGKRALVLNTLAGAWREASALMGEDSAKWRWGEIHPIQFRHPLFDRADKKLAEQMEFPVYPRGGSNNTTNSTAFRSDDFSVRSGASYRMALDVGNWDAARMTNAPGQSGDPRSPFYDNLLKGWAEDSSFPLFFSREKILEHKSRVITLLPDKSSK